MKSSSGTPAGVQRFTDSTPAASAARTSTRNARRSPNPDHSASPWRSTVSSRFSSTKESRPVPTSSPPRGSASTTFGMRSAAASSRASRGKLDGADTATTQSRERRAASQRAARNVSAAPLAGNGRSRWTTGSATRRSRRGRGSARLRRSAARRRRSAAGHQRSTRVSFRTRSATAAASESRSSPVAAGASASRTLRPRNSSR